MMPLSSNSQAPSVTMIHASFISDCLDTVTISFNSETNTPIVEVPARLEGILSFDAPELNSAGKFGVWLERSTLVVVFTECARLREEGSRMRTVHVIFEADRGELAKCKCSCRAP